MGKATFRATVSPKMGTIQIDLGGVGLTLNSVVRADEDPSASNVNATMRSIETNKKCLILWKPANYSRNITLFEDAKKQKSAFEVFELHLKVEGYPKDKADCKGATVTHIFRHHTGEQAVELKMRSVKLTSI